MRYTERPLSFACHEDTLAGILAAPDEPATTGVIVLVGGPQYRVGSHRQFVLLSRALAAAGYPVLRFDYRGMGDSTGDARDFTQLSEDVRAAIDALQMQLPSVTRVALWGLCDGASAALLYSHDTRDPRVEGLCLLNPWVRSESSLARAHVKHYYMRRLMQKEFWAKLLRGGVTTAAFIGLWRNLRTMAGRPGTSALAEQLPFQRRMAVAWGKFGGKVLLVLSGEDYTAKEFLEYARMDAAWAGLLERGYVTRHDLPGADHTFSSTKARLIAEVLTLEWLKINTAKGRPNIDARGRHGVPEQMPDA